MPIRILVLFSLACLLAGNAFAADQDVVAGAAGQYVDIARTHDPLNAGIAVALRIAADAGRSVERDRDA